jgi:hypothetical protein
MVLATQMALNAATHVAFLFGVMSTVECEVAVVALLIGRVSHLVARQACELAALGY